MYLQRQYDLIYSFFKTTTEPFDALEWNGEILEVWLKYKLIEIYSFQDLKEFINDL